MSLAPVIICGGAGSRLWPLSRKSHPKPFIRLGDGESLLQKAFLRGADLDGVSGVIVVTNRALFSRAEEELRVAGHDETAITFLLEPAARNTAAAVAAAALVAAERDSQAILLVLPADHLIADQAAFAAAAAQARQLAAEDKLVLFGVRPASPETGYGYVEVAGGTVQRFVEKPSAALAREYIASGRFLWSAGIFCVRAGVAVAEMEVHCPDILAAVRRSLAAVPEGGNLNVRELGPSFSGAPDVSFDRAVLEKSRRLAVVPCDMGWVDVGSWDVFGGLPPADAEGNRVDGDVVLQDVSNCHIRSAGRVIAAIGVKDLLIVDTPGTLLVADRSRVRDVALLSAQLEDSAVSETKVRRSS